MNNSNKINMPKETYEMISQIIKFIDKNDEASSRERKMNYEG